MSQIPLGSLTTLNLSTHLEPMFTELYELRAAFAVSSGVPRATGGLLIGSNDVYFYAGATDVLSIRVGPSSNYTFIDVKSMGGGYPMIDAPGGTLALGVVGSAKLAIEATAVRPATDNAISAGTASFRYSTVYAGTGSINTSDEREKEQFVALTGAELAAAKDLARAIGTFKWKAAVLSRGAAAPKHIGLTVQSAITILVSHGLDPAHYGFVVHDTWDEQGQQGEPDYAAAGDRYGFLSHELLLLIAAGFEARLTALEAAA